ncbi:hypothetical protein, partial [Sporosarcina sp. E16_8]|uniref:hypothetical protein n=1 Tax=Sporosarcina sp. E16_8 TaxID=2789295 RepID=UPI001A935F3E
VDPAKAPYSGSRSHKTGSGFLPGLWREASASAEVISMETFSHNFDRGLFQRPPVEERVFGLINMQEFVL